MAKSTRSTDMRKIDTSKAHYVGLDQRIAPRSDVYCRLPFVMPDGRQEMCTCVNISADGMLMRFERGLEIGDLVVLRMPISSPRSKRISIPSALMLTQVHISCRPSGMTKGRRQ